MGFVPAHVAEPPAHFPEKNQTVNTAAFGGLPVSHHFLTLHCSSEATTFPAREPPHPPKKKPPQTIHNRMDGARPQQNFIYG